MQHRRFTLILFAIFPNLCFGAGHFKIAGGPVYFNSSKNTDTIKVTNTSPDSALTLQVTPLAWKADRQGKYKTTTNKIIATPLVFKLSMGTSQIVHVATTQGNNTNSMQRYKLSIAEIRSERIDKVPHFIKKATGRDLGMKFFLGVNVPVYIMPHNIHVATTYTLSKAGTNKLILHAANKGNVIDRILALKLFSPSGKQVAAKIVANKRTTTLKKFSLVTFPNQNKHVTIVLTQPYKQKRIVLRYVRKSSDKPLRAVEKYFTLN